MRIGFTALLVISLALAGCSDGDKSDDGTTTIGPAPTSGGTTTGPAPTTSGGPTTSGPAPTTGAQNHAPTATLSASIEAGEAPLTVNFTLDGADADGDALTWTFDADGDGTSDEEGTGDDLPATASFAYDAPGTYTATLEVSDGTESDESSVDVEVTSGPVEVSTQHVEGEWTLGLPGCGAMGVPGAGQQKVPYTPGTPMEGVAWVSFQVAPGTVGHPFHAEFAISDAWLYVEIVFYDAAGAALLSVNDALDQNNDGHVRGEVPEGAATGVLYPCDPVPSTVVYDAGPDVA